MKYNKEIIASSIELIDKVIENNKKTVKTYYELKETLIRIQRALSTEFWFDKLDIDGKRNTYKNAIEAYKKRNPDVKRLPFWLESAFSFRDYSFKMREQWESDRKRLIKEGKIES